jgi:hypothetical protein
MKIEGNKIVYADHKVVLDSNLHATMPEYIEEMAKDLDPNGNARIHARELRDMNNDGSWTIEKIHRFHMKLADITNPSHLFYQWEIEESPEYCFPMKASQIRAYRYKTSKATAIRAGDVIEITGNLSECGEGPFKVKATVYGFYAHSDSDNRMMLCLADDGYLLVDPITHAQQIVSVMRNGIEVERNCYDN